MEGITEQVELTHLGLSVTDKLDDYTRRIDDLQRQVGYLQGAGSLLEPLSNVAGYNQVGLNAADPTLMIDGAEQVTFIGQAQLLLAGEGIEFSQPTHSPYLRISASNPWMCYDAIVDPCNENGTHTTLESAIADAIAASGDHFTILICCDITVNSTIDVSGLNKVIAITGLTPTTGRLVLGDNLPVHFSAAPVITGPRFDHLLEALGNTVEGDAGTSVGLGFAFSNLGLQLGANQSILSFPNVHAGAAGESRIAFLSFVQCNMGGTDRGYFLTNDLNSLSTLAFTDLIVQDCTGNVLGFFESNHSGALARLDAIDNKLRMSEWWTDATANTPRVCIIQGGTYRLDSPLTMTTTTGAFSQTYSMFKDLVIESISAFDHVFDFNGTSDYIQASWENITFTSNNPTTAFGTFNMSTGNTRRTLFIHGITGVSITNTRPFRTFITVDAGLTGFAYVSDIHAPHWDAVYSGPTMTPSVPPVIDHGALTSPGGDDHSQYALLAGRDGGQTLIGDTASGGALTLQSNASNDGNVIIADGTLVINAQDGVDEGGELQLLGAAANADWVMDNYQGRVRLHSGVEYFNFRVDGMEIGIAADPFTVAIGGLLVANTKLMLAGSIVSANHAFALHFGSVELDPADGFNAYGLFGGGTVVATPAETVANAYSMFAAVQAKTGAGGITNAYGLYIEEPTIGDVLNLGIYSGGTIEFVKQLYKGTNIDGSHITVNVAAQGGTLTSDNTGITIQLGPVAGGTALNGHSVIAVSGNMVSRASGAGAVIGGEFAARMGGNITAFTGDMRGVYAHTEVQEAGGGKTIPKMYGIIADIGTTSIAGGYVVTDAYSGYFATPDPTNIGTITNAWALYSEGPTMLEGQTFLGDASYYTLLSGGNPLVGFDAGDFWRYTRAANQWDWVIGGTQKLLLNSTVFEVGTPGSAPQLIMRARDGVNAGGRIAIDGAAANADWIFYNLAGAMNWWSPSGTAMVLNTAGQLQLPITGASAGLLIGADTLLYRSAADHLRTPDTFIVDADLGIGTAAVPHAGVGWARLAIEGANASADGPHIQLTNAPDDHPLMQFFMYTHDNLAINYDAYFDGAWKSSHVGSNFNIYKINNKLEFRYDSGVAAGAILTWNVGMSLNVAGQVAFPQSGPSAGLLLGGDALLYRSAANVLRTPDALIVDGLLTASGSVVIGGTLEVGTVQTYTESNVTTDRSYNADATTMDELADILGTLIADLRAIGIIN